MRIKNTSKYDAEECRRLIEFAVKGVCMTGVAVNVKNCQHGAYAGMAYDFVPHCSPLRHLQTVRRLIVLRIGDSKHYPCDNMCEHVRWERTPDDWTWEQAEEKYGNGNVRSVQGVDASGQSFQYVQGRIAERYPYGGKRAPLIECRNWREGLVMLAAHEARHIHQYRGNKRRSEVDCERFAAKRLSEYRRSVA